ncbi:MAG: DMT family transporter [Saprospiraceae bacterium]|nr:DMT family transporter [Saprospiraceae bacterium]
MQYALIMLLALIAGAILPVQAALNARVGQIHQNPFWPSLISFLVGTVALAVYILIARVPTPTMTLLKQTPIAYWTPGLLGAVYVTSVVLITPRLGVTLTFAMIVTGQMLIALLIDQYGLMGVPIKEISPLRILGALLLVAGVVLVRK